MLGKRKQYVALQQKVVNQLPLTAEEEEKLDTLEEEIPLDTLIIWKGVVLAEAKKGRIAKQVSKDLDRDVKTPAGRLTGYFSKLWNGSRNEEDDAVMIYKEEVEEGDISVDDLVMNVIQEEQATPKVVDYELFQVSMVATGGVRLYGNGRVSLLEARNSFQVLAKQKGEALGVRFILDELFIKDLYTPTPVFNQILGPEGEEKDSILDVNFSTDGHRTDLLVKSRPLIIAYNRGWVGSLLQVFRPPPGYSEALAEVAAQNLTAARDVAKNALKDRVLNIDMDIAAPKLYIPIKESEDKGFLLLDNGHLTFKGCTITDDPGASKWDLKVSNIQSKMPPTKKSWLEHPDKYQGQIIEPFGISVVMQISPHEEDAGVLIDAQILGQVKGIMEPQRLENLLYIVTNLGLPEQEDENQVQVLVEEHFGADLSGFHTQTLDTAELEKTKIYDAEAENGEEETPRSREIVEVGAKDEGKQEIISPTKVNLSITVVIPEVLMDLESDEGDKLFVLSTNNLNVSLVSRAYDSTLEVNLATFSIIALKRPKDCFDHLALTEAEEGQYLVHFVMKNYQEKSKSPDYEGFDRILILEFAKLSLNADAKTVVSLKPFYDAIVNPSYLNEEAVIPAKPIELQRDRTGSTCKCLFTE